MLILFFFLVLAWKALFAGVCRNGWCYLDGDWIFISLETAYHSESALGVRKILTTRSGMSLSFPLFWMNGVKRPVKFWAFGVGRNGKGREGFRICVYVQSLLIIHLFYCFRITIFPRLIQQVCLLIKSSHSPAGPDNSA
jgi:hypothetical protein